MTTLPSWLLRANPLDRPHKEQISGSPRPEDAALELGLRGLGPKGGRTALGRARDEARVAGKGHHGALALGPVAGSAHPRVHRDAAPHTAGRLETGPGRDN